MWKCGRGRRENWGDIWMGSLAEGAIDTAAVISARKEGDHSNSEVPDDQAEGRYNSQLFAERMQERKNAQMAWPGPPEKCISKNSQHWP